MDWKWTKDFSSAIAWYRKAIDAKPDEAFFLEEFAHAAEEAGLPPAERYAVLHAHHETAVKRSGALRAECINGTFVGDLDYVLGLMRTGYFPTFEGAGDFHACYVDALLLRGDELLAAGDPDAALAHFAECYEYPEGHQTYVENLRGARDAQIWHAMARAYQAKGLAPKAAEYFEKSAGGATYGEFAYWKGLSLQALGRADEARALGEELVREGSREHPDKIDFFGPEGNHFGRTIDLQNAHSAYLKGLGELLLGQAGAARAAFARCLALRPDHLWADRLGK